MFNTFLDLLTIAADQGGGVAGPPFGTVTLGSSSVRFPNANLQFAGQTGVIKQTTAGLTGLMPATGGEWGVILNLPQEVTHKNLGFGIFGNTAGSNPGQFSLTYYGTDFNNAALRGLFNYNHRSDGSTTSLDVASAVPFNGGRVLVAPRRDASNNYYVDFISCDDATITAGTAVNKADTGVPTPFQSAFYIGDAVATASEATTATTGRGGFPGEIEAIYHSKVPLNDAQRQAIALGGDIPTIVGASNLNYYRRLADTSTASLSKVSGTADATATATIIGSLRSGGNIRRQNATNYVTLNRVAEGYVYGLRAGETTQAIPFAGTASGTAYSATLTVQKTPVWGHREVRIQGGCVQGRFVLEDGRVWKDWTTLTGSIATGAEGAVFIERSRVAVGYKIGILGQSQCDIIFSTTTLGMTPGATRKVSYASLCTDLSTRFREQIRVIEGNAAYSDAMVAFNEAIADTAGCPIQIMDLAVAGTSAIDLIDDTLTGRTWATPSPSMVDTLNSAGNDVSAIVWQWFSTDVGYGSAFGTSVLDAVYYGTGVNAKSHYLTDGTFRNGFAFIISPASRTANTSAGPFDFDSDTNTGAARTSMVAWANLHGKTVGPYINDMKVAAGQGPHQDTASVRGNVRFAIRLGEAFIRGMGLTSRTNPTISNPAFTDGTKVAFTLTATLPNGGALRTDLQATYDANIQGFELSTDGGSTWSRSGFTAAITATNKVTITKSSGSWTTVQVRYCYGGPLGYGTSTEASELVRGTLYDGVTVESGLGTPVGPMAATGVV